MPNLKKGKAKFIIAAFFVFIVTIAVSQSFPKNSSTLTLTGSQNKFYLSFNFTPQDKLQFSKFLEKLSLPKSIEEGVTLNPETSSAAKLALFTPIKAQIQPRGNSVSIQGRLNYLPILKPISLVPFKVPDSTNLFIASADLSSLVKNKLPLPQNVRSWLNQSLQNSKTKYFVLFGQNYALIFEKEGVDFDALKNLKDEKGEGVYKEETQGDTKKILLALPGQFPAQKDVISLFQNEKYTFFVSSAQGAQEFQAAQGEDKNNLIFPTQNLKEKPTFALMVKNPSQNQSKPSVSEVLFDTRQKFSFTDKIQTLYLTLANDKFSGIMNLK